MITNTTGNAFNLDVLLCDNDEDDTNIFKYAYEIYINGTPVNHTEITGYSGTLRRCSKQYIVTTVLADPPSP